MTYSINGTTFTLQPTSGRWIIPALLGIDGNGHAVYSRFAEYEMKWNIATEANFKEINDFFGNMLITGTVVVSLPKFSSSTYSFFDYSGCIIQAPNVGEYFEQHKTEITLIVTHIRT